MILYILNPDGDLYEGSDPSGEVRLTRPSHSRQALSVATTVQPWIGEFATSSLTLKEAHLKKLLGRSAVR